MDWWTISDGPPFLDSIERPSEINDHSTNLSAWYFLSNFVDFNFCFEYDEFLLFWIQALLRA